MNTAIYQLLPLGMRVLAWCFVAFAIFGLATQTTFAQAGNLETRFPSKALAGTNNNVLPLVIQPDGKMVIGGFFTSVNGAPRGRIARLNADGTLDNGFGNGLSGADGVVEAIAVQPDGKVIIGGNFTTVNGTARSCIARLNADGTLDTGFGNGLTGANSTVKDLALQPDGKVVIGGAFVQVNSTSRRYIARLHSDGTTDMTFGNGMIGANSNVEALAIQPDGKVVIGGGFTQVNGTARVRIARLNADGALDTSFGNGFSGLDGPVYALAV